jgi:hypothetical protein
VRRLPFAVDLNIAQLVDGNAGVYAVSQKRLYRPSVTRN